MKYSHLLGVVVLLSFLTLLFFVSLYCIGYYGEPSYENPREHSKLTRAVTKYTGSVHLVSYAHGETFIRYAKDNHKAMKPWFDTTTLWHLEDLSETFRTDNAELLQVKEGAGLWVWKPQVIAQAWDAMELNQVLVYLDGGLRLKEKPVDLIARCVASESGILVNADANNLVPLGVRCKGAIFRACQVPITKEFCNHPIVEAGFIILHKKSSERPALLQEWLHISQIPGMLSAEELMEGPHPPEFRRNFFIHDQSIFNVLVWKHRVEISIAPRSFIRVPQAKQDQYRWDRWQKRAKIAIADGWRILFKN